MLLALVALPVKKFWEYICAAWLANVAASQNITMRGGTYMRLVNASIRKGAACGPRALVRRNRVSSSSFHGVSAVVPKHIILKRGRLARAGFCSSLKSYGDPVHSELISGITNVNPFPAIPGRNLA
jgi:hypothetical protein